MEQHELNIRTSYTNIYFVTNYCLYLRLENCPRKSFY